MMNDFSVQQVQFTVYLLLSKVHFSDLFELKLLVSMDLERGKSYINKFKIHMFTFEDLSESSKHIT